MNEKKLITVSEFWDCECTEEYIQHKSMRICLACSTTQNDQPDSRLDEVIVFLFTTISN